MSTFDRLAGYANSIGAAKRDAVAAATEQKKAEVGGLEYQGLAGQQAGTGMDSASPQEQALRTQDANTYAQNYGFDALVRRADAAGQLVRDQSGQRTFSQGAGDVVTDVGLGLANAVGGIGALGTGLFNEEAGANLASQIGDLNEWAQGTQSGDLQARRRVNQARTAEATRDNAAQYEKDIAAGDSTLVAGLARIGRDAFDSVAQAVQDPATLGSGVSQGVGSLLAAGPLIKGFAKVGQAVIPNSVKAGVGAAAAIDTAAGSMSAARILNAAAGAAPAAAAVGTMEAGGAYQQVTAEVMKKDFAELAKTSPLYQDLIKQGVSPEDARVRVANATGKMAAAIQAPVGAATGPLVARLESNPFTVGNMGQFVGNLLRETVEEGIQSGSGQLAQNLAERRYVDPNTDILEGVGEQAGVGALYGFGTAGAVQVPGASVKAAGAAVAPAAAVMKGTLNTVKAAANTALSPIMARGEAVMKQNEQASPVADRTVQAAAAEAVQTADQAAATMKEAVDSVKATPEEKTEANQYIDDLVNAAKFNPAELDQPSMPQEVKDAVSTATTRAEAFEKLSDLINKSDEGSDAHMAASLTLHDMVGTMEGFFERMPSAIEKLPADHPAQEALAQFSNLAANLGNTPKVLRALRAVQGMLSEAQVKPVTEANIATPAGEQNIKLAVAQAEAAPEKANPEVIGQILKHASEGKIALNNSQLAALKSASALLQGARQFDSEAERLGLRPQDIVGKQIKTDETRAEGQYSALQHAKGIRSAYNAGNLDLAAARLDDFLKFAQHMQNKVGALNEHLISGNGDPNRSVKYQSLTAGRDWVESRKGLGVNPYDTKSVKFAQQVGLEAKTVGEIANALATAYPELKVDHVELVPLDQRLDAPASEVVKSFRQRDLDVAREAKKAAPAEEVVKEEPPVVTEEPAATVPPKAEPVVEAKQEDVTPETPAAPAQEPAVEKTGTAAVYPNLIEKNQFTNSFTLPTEARTRVIGSEAPLEDIAKVLTSNARMAAHLGAEANSKLDGDVIASYKDVMEVGRLVAQNMRDSLAKFVADDKIMSKLDREPNRWVMGKSLNITEQVGDTLQYNESLLQTAVLAGLQWRLTAVSRGSVKDMKDVASILGIDENLVPDNLLTDFQNGMTAVEAVNALAQKVESYWGLQRNADAPIGYTKGIPAAVASELLAAFVKRGDVEVQNIAIDDMGNILADGEPGKVREVNLYRIRPLEDDDAVRQYPTAIEEAVLVNPEEKLFIGEDRPPVARTQLRNPGVENTPDQVRAIRNEQNTPFYIHNPTVRLYEALGREGILELFANGKMDEEVLNINDARSMDGQNRSIAAAFDQLSELTSQVDDQPIFYGYNMTRVGRMQMLGKYNPQSSKLMREAVLPTQSTLDLSNENTADFSAFALGLAQALGVKVETKPRADAVNEVMGMLKGPMAEAVEMIRAFQNEAELPPNAVDVIRKALGGKPSFVGLMALQEYARYLHAENRSEFNTPLYVEADGKTNGPINAMALMTGGRFTSQWVTNMAKGGMFLGEPGKTLNDHYSKVDSRDLYQTTTDALAANVKVLRESLRDDPALSNQMTQLQTLMDLFLPDLSVNDAGELELKRGIAKNPLTITVYGSGAAGIAGKVVSTMVGEIYKRMSQVLQSRAADPNVSAAEAMFGPQSESPAHAEEMLGKFLDAMETLTSGAVTLRKGKLVLESTGSGHARKMDPKTYTLKADQMKALQANMLHLFVTPLRDAINSTIGEPLMEATREIQKATQVQSLFLQDAYKRGLDQAMEAKKAADPSWKESDFLSQKEMDAVMKSLAPLAPMIETGAQTFFVAGSETAEFGGNRHIARSLDESVRVPATFYGPSDAGVAGIPFLTIGMGDGMMMQELAAMKNGPTGTLKIFDGMNMKLSTITEDSVKANEAVYKSWQGNPAQAVSDSFQKFMKNADFSNMSDDLQAALRRSLLEPKYWNEKVKPEVLEAAALALGNRLANTALEVKARHNVMNRVQVTVDQMGAVGASYTNKGTVDFKGLTTDEKVAVLNQMFNEELAKLKAPAESTVEKEKLNPAFEAVGRVHAKSGARVLSVSAIKNLGKISRMSPEQAAVLNEIQKSLAAKEYKVVFGTPDQVNLYAELTGKQMMEPADLAEAKKGNIDGWTTFDDKTIYLTQPRTETLIHELVHAATFESVYAHYMGQDLGLQGRAVSEAVGRLEKLMDQFVAFDVSKESPEFQDAYTDAKMAIQDHLNNGFSDASLNKAAALNEFMAWGLTNRELSSKMKATPSLVQLIKDVIAGIKQLIWGRKVMPKVGEDMFSNLLFNSAIIMRSQPSIMEVTRDTTLFQSHAYGADTRLAELNQTFDKLVTDYIGTDPVDQITTQSKVDQALMSATRLMVNVQANGFPMTTQEQSTFQMVVAALGTQAAIDPNSLAYAQELYSHVTKNAKVEDFMADPEANDPSDRYFAQEKYNVIMGNYLTETDAQGRSSLLPVFLGLAMVHDDLRQVLAKMPVPKANQKQDVSLDNILTNAGTKAMQALNQTLAGARKAGNVTEAVDALARKIREVAQDRQTVYDSVATPTGNFIDRANDYIVQQMERLSDSTIAKADGVIANPDASKLAKGTAQAARLIAAVATEKNGAAVAEGVMTAMNKSKAWQPFHDFVNDLVGRTASNAGVYDMIKAVKSQVSQDRQQFREHLPTTIAEKFTRRLEDHEWSALHTGLGKADVAALRDHFSPDEIRDLLSKDKSFDRAVNNLEGKVQAADPAHWKLIQSKAKQLANYMITGVAGSNLLRNADAVANLLGERKRNGRAAPTASMVQDLDALISMYALEAIPSDKRAVLKELAETEVEGMDFSTAYMVGQRVEEQRKTKANKAARFNAYKGYIPAENQQGLSLVVADDADFATLAEKSYVRIGDYKGSSADRFRGSRGYYFAPVSARSPFSQGIAQNVRSTAGGVDTNTGFTNGMTAGRITDRNTIAQVQRLLSQGEKGTETLLPVYDAQGNVTAYERSIDPARMAALNADDHFAKMVGVWRGRQVEEAKAQFFNDALVDKLHSMFKADGDKGQYVNVLDPREQRRDPVMADAVRLLNQETLDRAQGLFGEGEFWVRKDMLNDTFGYRSASVGDVWTGNSRWGKDTQDATKKLLLGVFGNNAYKYVMGAENVVQNVVKEAKTLIVVKSVIVPAVNFLANIYQMVGRGVPMKDIVLGIPKKTSEINQYLKTRLRQLEAEAELRAAQGDAVKERKLQAEIQSITDSHKRLSIWPLLERGEFSSISDAGISRDDILISEGKMQQYMEKLVDRLPKGLQTAGRYALITKDTALFQGIQKAVEYSDFMAKAIIYDDMTQRQKKSKEDALGRVTEEFINYDRLPGRFRGYMESMGLLWFYNFKIRSAKVAVSMIRNNPLHSLFATVAPKPEMFGNVGLPIEDNIFSVFAEGRLGYSIGPGQGLRAPNLNPWHNLVQ
ncbi:virion RNA polymerase [Achromobacter phage vB_AxyP_19-32_Axy11]|uniref:Putative virion-associated RNA polymerase n=1 Tax=Achromobacter phage vB_AxyP_19-32_Axy11 TaxID=2591042 RepID=A0A514CU46_9CAUD|nr:virion RNA polymerase [Achromobacter phage vB_AxyP_19-32_Axy11]QDH83996.1 putative virion-associated RNA polymerase [Achromobacter phage vB_AxyP_19-32_Axy11]